jgi:hypothetical protein
MWVAADEDSGDEVVGLEIASLSVAEFSWQQSGFGFEYIGVKVGCSEAAWLVDTRVP